MKKTIVNYFCDVCGGPVPDANNGHICRTFDNSRSLNIGTARSEDVWRIECATVCHTCKNKLSECIALLRQEAPK